MNPFPEIPVDAFPFYASDAYSRQVQPGNPYLINWGCANTKPQPMVAGQEADIWIVAGSFSLVMNSAEDSLCNVDVDLQLYNVETGTVPTGNSATFTGPYGDQAFGKWLNACCHTNKRQSNGGLRNLPYPIQLRSTAPTNGLYMVGPKILFFSGITVPAYCHFEFFIQGAWKTRPL